MDHCFEHVPLLKPVLGETPVPRGEGTDAQGQRVSDSKPRGDLQHVHAFIKASEL